MERTSDTPSRVPSTTDETILADLTDGLVLDLDGTVYHGSQPIPSAVETLAQLDHSRAYVTNNASRTAQAVVDALKNMGVEARTEQVMTSAMAAVDNLQKECAAGSAVLVLGTATLSDLIADAGFTPVRSADDDPVAVIHGHNPETGWPELSEAALAIAAGARYFATNRDATLPAERGMMVGNGSMVMAVVNATGVDPVSTGKPEPTMYQIMVERLGMKQPLVVGDRLDTDIAAGVAGGFDSLMVMTGVSGHYDLLQANPSLRPTYIGRDLTALHQPASALRPAASAHWDITREGDVVTVASAGDTTAAAHREAHGGEADLELLRAVLAVVWADDESATPTAINAADDYAQEVLDTWR